MDYYQKLNEINNQNDIKKEIQLLWLGCKYNYQVALNYFQKLNNKQENDNINFIINKNLDNNMNYKYSILTILFCDSCAVRLYAIDEIIYRLKIDKNKSDKQIANDIKRASYNNKDKYRLYIYTGIDEDINGIYRNSALREDALKENASRIIHIILRHATAHMQNKRNKKIMSDAVNALLENMTLKKFFSYLSDVVNEFGEDLSNAKILDSSRQDFINEISQIGSL